MDRANDALGPKFRDEAKVSHHHSIDCERIFGTKSQLTGAPISLILGADVPCRMANARLAREIGHDGIELFLLHRGTDEGRYNLHDIVSTIDHVDVADRIFCRF